MNYRKMFFDHPRHILMGYKNVWTLVGQCVCEGVACVGACRPKILYDSIYSIYIYIIVINNRPVDAFYFSLTLVRSDNTRIIWWPIEVAPIEIAAKDRRRAFIGSKVVYATIRVVLYYFFTQYLRTKKKKHKYIIICD